jgi:putative oxidoreductase
LLICLDTLAPPQQEKKGNIVIDQHYAPYAALLLRLSLGTMWISHALLKLLVFTIPGFQAFLAAQGMPAFMAWPVVLMELAGGAMILLGYHGRIASLALLPVLAGATLAHIGNGWVFSAPNGGWEYPAFLLAASAIHALLGDGAYALSSTRPSPGLRVKTA